MEHLDVAFATIIGAMIALAGSVLAQFLQSNSRKYEINAQAEIDKNKRDEDLKQKKQSDMEANIAETNLLISNLQREFCQVMMDIDAQIPLTEAEYNVKFKELCKGADKIRMIADLFMPATSSKCDALSGEMYCYWGNFTKVLAYEAKGIDSKSVYSAALSAANKVNDIGNQIKKQQAEILRELRYS